MHVSTVVITNSYICLHFGPSILALSVCKKISTSFQISEKFHEKNFLKHIEWWNFYVFLCIWSIFIERLPFLIHRLIDATDRVSPILKFNTTRTTFQDLAEAMSAFPADATDIQAVSYVSHHLSFPIYRIVFEFLCFLVGSKLWSMAEE